MKKIAALGAVFAALVLLWVPSASAVQLSGGFSIGGPFRWVNNLDPADDGAALNGSANAVDFRSFDAPGDPSPGVPGDFVVIQRSKDFVGLISKLEQGKIKDFTYSGLGTLDFPNVPILSFETLTNVTVDILSITNVVRKCPSGCEVTGEPSLLIEGTLLFHATGFDPTFGTFNFQGGKDNDGNFSFAAQQSVPEPTSMILLGLGLTGLVLGRRLKK